MRQDTPTDRETETEHAVRQVQDTRIVETEYTDRQRQNTLTDIERTDRRTMTEYAGRQRQKIHTDRQRKNKAKATPADRDRTPTSRHAYLKIERHKKGGPTYVFPRHITSVSDTMTQRSHPPPPFKWDVL
jgi:hypothetical protein